VPQAARIPLWTHINYSIGTMAPSALIVFSRSFLLFFYSQVVGLDAWLAGIALTIGRVWDAVADPLMGAISDRTRSRWGRRRPYIVLGALPLALSYVALWVPPLGWSQASLFVYLVATDILFNTLVTVVVIPYTSLGAELSTDYHERTRVTAIRVLFYQVGWFMGAVGVRVNQMLLDAAHQVGGAWATVLSFRDGYAMCAVVFGAITVASLVWSGYAVKENGADAAACVARLHRRISAYAQEQDLHAGRARVPGGVAVRIDRVLDLSVPDRVLVLPGRHGGDEQQPAVDHDAALLRIVPGGVVLDRVEPAHREEAGDSSPARRPARSRSPCTIR
jgi:Na+/melibiose symporter-like transporter